MRLVVNGLAIVAALADSKLLVWDIAVGDLRRGSGGVLTVGFAVLVSAAFVLLPIFGLRAARGGLVMGLASLGLSAAGFVILASAFTP